MSGWDGLVAAALLGTERRAPEPASAPEALERLDWDDPEGALLSAAAVLATARVAAPRAQQVPAPAAAPEDPAPRCTPGADAILARILDEWRPAVLEEWLGRATRAGVRAWPERLPDLLDAATASRPLRAAVLSAGGPRAGWLAAHAEDWAWASGAAPFTADVEQRWETGTRDERLALLDELRQDDPAAARALVEATWDTDAPDDRRAFIHGLETGLGPDDEPLLERALDDRRKPVRQAAAELLAKLPGSALSERMAERLAPRLNVSRKRLEVDPPDTVDAGMARDGVEEKGMPAGMGEKAWWLSQMVATAPLSLWAGRVDPDPLRVIELARGDRALLAGWRTAAVRQRDDEWLAALATVPDALEVAGTLPPAAARALLRRERSFARVMAILDSTPGPWDREMSDAAVAAVRNAKAGDATWFMISLTPIGERLDPPLRDDVAAALSRDALAEEVSPPGLIDALAVLDLRHDMHREIP